jgi:hypothetical protein
MAMRTVALVLLAALFVSGCGGDGKPPVQLDAVHAAVVKQLGDSMGERFVKAGKATYDGEKDCYHVEVFYKTDEKEARQVLALEGMQDADRKMKIYRGQFPRDLVGQGNPQGRSYYDVTVDALMNP